ncbi:MAG TPA: alpha/beta fold hydrolase [Terracidiphilus sp.]|jgi:pimeloyl-ACP methyl ester carboxylesterase|nr:alpha/beta fold hydrolase [Terracidiphilus sp.]
MSAYTSAETTLNYVDQGSGMAVVFLHPTPLDHDYWRPLLAGLPGVRAIVPDFRGHGASELGTKLPVGGFARVPDAPVLTMAQLAADVLALLDFLSIETAAFAGCSVGGYVLLELWRQAPQRMRGLAFVCSKPQADGEAALAKRAENIARVRSQGASAFFDTMANTLLGATARRERPQLIAEVRARMTLTAEAVVAVQAGLATRPDSLPTVKTIDVPVLSIAGGEDGSVSPAKMEAFAHAPGGCESHVLADAGHLAAYEQPQKVAGIFGDWLRRV